MPKLLLKFETAVMKEIRLDKPVYTVGRKPDNDIVLENATVSGHHCKLYGAGGSWFVEDLNSTNGTFVNGKKVLKAGLRNNDSVGIVKYFLIFVEDAPAQDAAPSSGRPVPESKAEPELPPQRGRVQGGLEVLEGGGEGKTEYELTSLSAYIGKTAQANIPYKGAGIFNTGPDIAAVITMRPEGYYLVPIKEGFAKHNGNPLNEKVLLKDDDTIEAGTTRFRFFIKK
ncbi:MAG: FHA domain-containing protein [Elusimicrobiales bacterium]|jgi:pSer/pThr/pTyr-binding forkhead associated (FHA) protein